MVLNCYNGHVFRWGNVVGSNGSAIPFFARQIAAGKSVPITDKNMTRFWLTIERAVEFMCDTTVKAGDNLTLIPTILKAAPVLAILDAIADILDKPYEIHEIGLRPGEKIHEDMSETLNSNNAPKFTHRELVTLIKPVVEVSV